MDYLDAEDINDTVGQLLWETAHGRHPWSTPTTTAIQEHAGNQEHKPDNGHGDGILPTPAALSHARSCLPSSLPSQGQGYSQTKSHILTEIIPALNASSLSPNYYGFVTGGVTPAALLADHVVSTYDQNVQVHLPEHSVATDVEACSLRLLLDLFDLDSAQWAYATLTTGATASNLLGLACGREFVLRAAAAAGGLAGEATSVGEHGILHVMRSAGLEHLQVLSTMSHSSLAKAAGIVGIGRANVKDVSAQDGDRDSRKDDAHPLRFDFDSLEQELSTPGVASIVVVSCGEVNTGHFATGPGDIKRLRQLCDRYNAWLHVDGAFGIFARVLDAKSPEFSYIRSGSEHLELADSITGDAHKLLNVPYDCGFFFCRHPDLAGDVFQNPNAAYLSSGSKSGKAATASPSSPVMSPNNIGIENSRRFRALPVYAALLAYGRDGYRAMLERQVRLARQIAAWLFDHPKYISLPVSPSKEDTVQSTFMIVLFSAADDEVNAQLAKKINSSSRMFVSGTVWRGRPACRIAISDWKVDVERDFDIVTGVLDDVARS